MRVKEKGGGVKKCRGCLRRGRLWWKGRRGRCGWRGLGLWGRGGGRRWRIGGDALGRFALGRELKGRGWTRLRRGGGRREGESGEIGGLRRLSEELELEGEGGRYRKGAEGSGECI